MFYVNRYTFNNKLLYISHADKPPSGIPRAIAKYKSIHNIHHVQINSEIVNVNLNTLLKTLKHLIKIEKPLLNTQWRRVHNKRKMHTHINKLIRFRVPRTQESDFSKPYKLYDFHFPTATLVNIPYGHKKIDVSKYVIEYSLNLIDYHISLF